LLAKNQSDVVEWKAKEREFNVKLIYKSLELLELTNIIKKINRRVIELITLKE